MTDIIHPGAGVVFMKVGTHAREPLPDIIARKRQEIEDAGYALWGYGGNTCHPLTSVQPFARDFVEREGAIYLVMHPMQSNHFAIPERADEFSADGIDWQDVPPAINVRGSRYALAISSLDEEEFELPLDQTRVAVGNSLGRRGDLYIKGRVDKACLEVVEDRGGVDEAPPLHIGLVARLVEPYAVLLRTTG
jgi:hypothetical protein